MRADPADGGACPLCPLDPPMERSCEITDFYTISVSQSTVFQGTGNKKTPKNTPRPYVTDFIAAFFKHHSTNSSHAALLGSI